LYLTLIKRALFWALELRQIELRQIAPELLKTSLPGGSGSSHAIGHLLKLRPRCFCCGGGRACGVLDLDASHDVNVVTTHFTAADYANDF
jgi:hypothetical protein